MTQRREQRGREVCALAERVARLPLAQEVDPLDGYRDDAAQRIERADVDDVGIRGEHPDGARPEPQRQQRDRTPRGVGDRRVPAVGARACVVLEHAPLSRDRLVQLRVRWMQIARPALQRRPALVAGDRDRHRIQLEPARDVPRQRRQRAVDVCREQDVPAEVEQPADLLPAFHGVVRAGLRDRRQLTADPRHDEERNERHPVLRIGNRERADRRQEEVVEREDAGNGRRGRDPHARQRRRAEDDEQQGQGNGGRIRDRQQAHADDNDAQYRQRCSQFEEPPADAGLPSHGHSLQGPEGDHTKGLREAAGLEDLSWA